MIRKKMVCIFILCACILTGCQKEVENNYLGNLHLSYQLKGEKNQVDQSEFEFFYGYAFEKYLGQVQNALGEDNSNVLPFQLSNDINSLKDQICTIDGYTDKSWEEYFSLQALNYYQEINGLYNEAIRSGMKEDDEIQSEADAYYKKIESYCSENNIAIVDYLHSLYGLNANQDFIIKVYKKVALASLYTNKLMSEPKDDEVEKYYNQNKNKFDNVSIRYIALEKNDKNKRIINDSLKQIRTEKDFQSFILKSVDDSLKSYYQEGDVSLRNNLRQEDVPEYLQTVLFDGTMKINDVKMVEGDDSYDVIMLLKREKPTYHQVNISTIYLDARETDSSTPTDKQWKACLDFANELYKQMNKEEKKDLETFHSYNLKYSDYKDNNGDYYGVSKRDSNQNIEKWIYDSSRKAGDMSVLKSENGYTIVYFIGQGDLEYFANAKKAYKEDIYNQKMERIKESIKVNLRIIKKNYYPFFV